MCGGLMGLVVVHYQSSTLTTAIKSNHYHPHHTNTTCSTHSSSSRSTWIVPNKGRHPLPKPHLITVPGSCSVVHPGAVRLPPSQQRHA